MATGVPLSRDHYTVGWICALDIEVDAAKLMLDTIHQKVNSPRGDDNTYTLGTIHEHNVVIASLPSGCAGSVSASRVAMQLRSAFQSVRFSFMVGIGGGIPRSVSGKDIRLGDIVVSRPEKDNGGVIQYDFGKTLPDGFERTGALNKPPTILLTAINSLGDIRGKVATAIDAALAKTLGPKTPTNYSDMTFVRPDEDRLYQTNYEHVNGSNTCANCDPSMLVPRDSLVRDYKTPEVHYGVIASGNQVMKDGRKRDQLARKDGVCCIEMEAAGLMDAFPCLVIRGISDYADSHKNDEWRKYAAVAAAVYAKELLSIVSVEDVQVALPARQPEYYEIEDTPPDRHSAATKRDRYDDSDDSGRLSIVSAELEDVQVASPAQQLEYYEIEDTPPDRHSATTKRDRYVDSDDSERSSNDSDNSRRKRARLCSRRSSYFPRSDSPGMAHEASQEESGSEDDLGDESGTQELDEDSDW